MDLHRFGSITGGFTVSISTAAQVQLLLSFNFHAYIIRMHCGGFYTTIQMVSPSCQLAEFIILRGGEELDMVKSQALVEIKILIACTPSKCSIISLIKGTSPIG